MRPAKEIQTRSAKIVQVWKTIHGGLLIGECVRSFATGSEGGLGGHVYVYIHIRQFNEGDDPAGVTEKGA
jgi:hypothetical protein